jgi:site-specific recombinase XerD
MRERGSLSACYFYEKRKSLRKEADMTREELSPEEFSFSTINNTSKESNAPPDPATYLTLETYLDALSRLESFSPGNIEESVKAHPPEPRRQELERVLKKLSAMELVGKEHVEEYVRHQYRCHFQPNTIRNSYNALVPFLRFVGRNGKRFIEEICKEDLEGFVEHEQDRGLKISTVGMRLAILKAFLRFMEERGVVGEEVFPWKLKIKMPESLPRALDPDDVQKLLAEEGSVRNRAMILLLLRTGMRIGELLNTRVADVQIEEQKILIYEGEKNQRGRVVYFSEDAKEALQAWLNQRDQQVDFLFYGYKGRALSYQAARLMFVKYLDKAGLGHKGYTLHCLRHTFATDLVNSGMSLECLEKLMGHSRLEVTRRYARVSDKTREEEYFKAMKVIERREADGDCGRDRELQAILEKTQLLPAHGEELHEHP